jgi:hypothetical protein
VTVEYELEGAPADDLAVEVWDLFHDRGLDYVLPVD